MANPTVTNAATPDLLVTQPQLEELRLRKKVPTIYETDSSKYAGPNRLQITAPAKWFRSSQREQAYTHWLNKAFDRIDIVGADYLRELNGPCVFIANHSSHLDTLLVDAALPAEIRRNTFFGAAQDRWFVKGKKKRELQPWYQSLVLGNFPILRGGGKKALDYAHWLITKKQNVFLFPEGTRATGDDIGAFKHGATLLAMTHNVPIVPIYLHGAKAARPKGSREVIKGRATVEILKPVQFAKGSDLGEATTLLHKRINRVHHRYLELERRANTVETAEAETSTVTAIQAA